MSPDFVRVELANGTQKSVPAAVAKRAGLKPLTKRAAFDRAGRVAPAKRRVLLGEEVPVKKNNKPEAQSSEKSQED